MDYGPEGPETMSDCAGEAQFSLVQKEVISLHPTSFIGYNQLSEDFFTTKLTLKLLP